MNFLKQSYRFFIFLLLLNVISAKWDIKSKIKSELARKMNSEFLSKIGKNIKSKAADYAKQKIGSKYFDLGKALINSTRDDSRENYSNVVLIKRLIPHGYVSKNEYDHKFKTYYVPLKRVPYVKSKYHNDVNDYSLENLKTELSKDNFEVLNKLVNSKKQGNYNDEELLAPFKEVKPKKITFQGILNDVRNYVERVDSSSEVRRLKYALMSVLENAPKKKLRALATLSEEREKPMDEKFLALYQGFHEKPPKKKRKPIPEYAFWNYWTYDKEIHQDLCQGNNLLQMGNQCMETPPH